MADTNPIKFAVIGYGHIGKRHVSTILEMSNAELVAVIDVKEIIVEKANHIPTFRSIEDFIESDLEIDVVSICTPNGFHSQHACTFLELGSHVVIEKPMGLHSTDCERVIKLADQKNKNAYCVMQNRYSPPAQWLKHIITENILGDIYLVQVNCFWNRDNRYYSKQNGEWRGSLKLDGGTLFTQFSHFVDLLYWIFQDLTIIDSEFRNFNHKDTIEFEDSGSFQFELRNGGMGRFNYTTSVFDSNFESSISIIGENGTIRIGGQYMNKVEYCNIKEYEFKDLEESNPPNDYGVYKGSANNHPLVLENVVNHIKGMDSSITTAEEGLEVVRIIEEIYKNRKL